MIDPSSDPFGSRAWNQRICKETRSAVHFQRWKQQGALCPSARNPITHEAYAPAGEHALPHTAARGRDGRVSSSVSSSSGRCSTASGSGSGSASSRDSVFRDRLCQLERTLLEERVSKQLVERELADLQAVCETKYRRGASCASSSAGTDACSADTGK